MEAMEKWTFSAQPVAPGVKAIICPRVMFLRRNGCAPTARAAPAPRQRPSHSDRLSADRGTGRNGGQRAREEEPS